MEVLGTTGYVLYTADVGAVQQTSEWSEGTSDYVLYTATTVDTGSTIDI